MEKLSYQWSENLADTPKETMQIFEHLGFSSIMSKLIVQKGIHNVESAKKAIYSYGHRNPQGMILHPNGEIWIHEHGPRGGDEINIIEAGENYGWPLASYGINYIGTKFTDKTSIDGMADPIHFWVPSIAPSGMVYVENPNYPSLNQSILIGSLKFQYLHQCVIKDGKVVEEKKLFDQIGRVRSVELDKDKNIFVGVENLGIIKLIE